MPDKKTKETMTKIGKTIVVEVESAVSLTDDQLSGMRAQLSDILETQNFMIQLKVNPDLIGGVSMRVNSLLIDASVKGRLGAFQKEVENEFSGEMTPAKLTDFFVQKVETFDDKPIVKEVGQVQSVSDGVAKVSGLKEIASGERVVFEGHQHGLVLNLNPDSVDVVIFDDAENIREGQKVFRTNEMNSVPVGMELLGRVINPL
ncbi:MAG: F0F1 ATP synthase subunit delta, partial [Alphaproteobacteria bacterium]|nr:F0F1 ATP synthase subunit delta [Alphaproteobacteria bacterium]